MIREAGIHAADAPTAVTARGVLSLCDLLNQDEFMLIRQRIAADNPRLLDIWLGAVRATHDFLQPSDIDALLPLVRDVYLPAVEVWVAVDADDCPQASSASTTTMWKCFSSTRIAGGGALAARCWISCAKRAVRWVSTSMNRILKRWGFYLHYGFVQTGRSPLDGEGRPFPLLHMSLPASR